MILKMHIEAGKSPLILPLLVQIRWESVPISAELNQYMVCILWSIILIAKIIIITNIIYHFYKPSVSRMLSHFILIMSLWSNGIFVMAFSQWGAWGSEWLYYLLEENNISRVQVDLCLCPELNFWITLWHWNLKKKIILFLTSYCKCNGVREGDPIVKETKWVVFWVKWNTL